VVRVVRAVQQNQKTMRAVRRGFGGERAERGARCRFSLLKNLLVSYEFP